MHRWCCQIPACCIFGTGRPLTWAVGNLHSALSVLASFFVRPKTCWRVCIPGNRVTTGWCFWGCRNSLSWREGACWLFLLRSHCLGELPHAPGLAALLCSAFCTQSKEPKSLAPPLPTASVLPGRRSSFHLFLPIATRPVCATSITPLPLDSP